MDYRKYMKRIQDRIGEIHAADRIQEETWCNTVGKELDEISRECAKDLQKEKGVKWKKEWIKSGSGNASPERGTFYLDLFESPPTRLLALTIAVGAWLGWVMHQKQTGENDVLSYNDCLKRFEDAFRFGKDLSIKKEIP